MQILLFSDNKRISEKLAALPRAQRPEVLPTSEVAKTVRRGYSGLIYLDLHKLAQAAYKRLLAALLKSTTAHTGIIDSAGVVEDPAELFHRGAVDYIGKAQWAAGLTKARVGRVAAFIEAFRTAPDAESEKKVVHRIQIAFGSDWSSITHGQEYTFYLMFVELDGKEEMEKKYGLRNLGAALLSFKEYVGDFVSDYGGRVWIWSKFGGIVLFPFDGKPSETINCGFRFMLFKHLYDIEESSFPNLISVRMALHVGNVMYHPDQTDQVISDTLNRTFHLGQQHTLPGSFAVTEDAFAYCPRELQGYFVPAGEFKDRNVVRMKRAFV